MKKTIPKGLKALFIVFLFGTLLASCGPIFDFNDNDHDGNGGGTVGGGGNPPPVTNPTDDFEAVKAYDAVDLAYYLASDETSYSINLTEIEDNDIYLQGNVSIVKPMRIMGSPQKVYIIHSVNKKGGNVFYCLDLQADLELQYCGFVGYNGTSRAENGMASGSPPIYIRAEKTLFMGRGSVLELRGVGRGSETRVGSQVKLGEGSGFVDKLTGDLLFNTGVEKLTVSGRVSLENNLTVGSGATLHIENGRELRVEPGATLKLTDDIKELRLDGNIVVDRTDSAGGSLVFAGGLASPTGDSLLEKITGRDGSLSIENGVTGETGPFEHGVNTTIRLSSNGISFTKKVLSDIGSEIRLVGDLTIPKGKKLVVGAEMDFNLQNNKLTLEGGTLDVMGNVNVTQSGQIIISAENKFNATPDGSVYIDSDGRITIDNGGTFIDESMPWDGKSFTFPTYGDGPLIINQKETGTGGKAVIGKNETGKTVIGTDAMLRLASSPESSITIRRGPNFMLSGNATLEAPSDLSLAGTFTVAGGATLKVNGILNIRAPNVLKGAATNQGVAPKIDTSSGFVFFYANATTTDLSSTFNGKTYSWTASGWE